MYKEERILVLCTGNSCRSQIAEGYLAHFGGRHLEVRSAGIESHGLNPKAVAVMEEDGIDISMHTSDIVDQDMLDWATMVITVCGHADDNCPTVPLHVEKRHIPFDDPAKATGSDEQVFGVFRSVRDRIRISMLGLAWEMLRKEVA